MTLAVTHADAEEAVIHIWGGIKAGFRCPLDRKVTWNNVSLATLQDDSRSRMDESIRSLVSKKQLHEAKRRAVGVLTRKRKELEKKLQAQAENARQYALPL